MLFARTACAVGAQAGVAAVFALRSSPTPWRDAEPWLPVYGTLIDAGCLVLLWRLTRREGIRLFDIVGFERTRIARDVLLGFALIPLGLVFIFGGMFAAGWLLYGADGWRKRADRRASSIDARMRRPRPMKRTWTIISVADVGRGHPGTSEFALRDPDGY